MVLEWEAILINYSLSIVENLGPVHTNQKIFFKSHPFYPEVDDSQPP